MNATINNVKRGNTIFAEFSEEVEMQIVGRKGNTMFRIVSETLVDSDGVKNKKIITQLPNDTRSN